MIKGDIPIAVTAGKEVIDVKASAIICVIAVIYALRRAGSKALIADFQIPLQEVIFAKWLCDCRRSRIFTNIRIAVHFCIVKAYR